MTDECSGATIIGGHGSMKVSLDTLAKRALRIVQRGVARSFDVVAGDHVRRGETFEVTVKADPTLDGLEAGLICTETFLATMRGKASSSRVFEDEVTYEIWRPIDHSEQTVALSVPLDAPYSYSGEYLKFNWRVAVRQRRERGPDAVRTREIWVLP